MNASRAYGVALLVALGATGPLSACSSGDSTEGSGAGGDGAAGGGDAGGGGSTPACTPGEVVTCYSGAAGTEDVGACRGGEKTCDASGAFGACEGEVAPAAETCGNALDDDCNGKIDDGCPCDPGEVVDCYSGGASTMGVGICHGGQQTCLPDGSGFGDCFGEQTPLAEDCATPMDESCDGETLDAAAGCVCAPGAIEACYSGPQGTEGVGVCQGGERTCDASGKAWGPCDGEVVPTPEICSQAEDEDCDGHACAEPLWSVLLGGPGDQTPVAVAQDGSGNVFVLGSFDGTIHAGSVSLTNAGTADVFLIKLDPSGNALWGRRYGGDPSANVTPTGLAVDAAGNVLLSVNTWGTIDFGGGAEPAPNDGYDDAFAVKLTPHGDFVWSRRFSGAEQQAIEGVAAGPGGEVYITGYHYPAIDFGGGPVSCAATSCPFAARLDGATGAVVWGKAFASTKYSNRGAAVAVDPAGNVVLLGSVYGTVDFGGAVVDSQTFINGFGTYASHFYVAKLTSQGDHVWSTQLGGNYATRDGRLAVDAQGGIVVGGIFAQTMSLAGQSFQGSQLGSAFVASLDASGTAQWARAYAGQYASEMGGVGAGPAGSAAVGLSSLETVDFGDGPLTTKGGYDMFVGRYGAGGVVSWGRQYGDAKNQEPGPLLIAPGGEVVITGKVQGVVDFGTGPLTATAADVVVAKLAP
jgi:hypothetical protein